MVRALCRWMIVACVAVSPLAALTPEILQPVRSVPPEVAGRFRDVRGFQRSAAGQHYVFDRRAHRVFGVDERFEDAWPIVQIGAESGRILSPTAFSAAPDGNFAVADAPEGRQRIQIFNPAGFRIAGFLLPERARPRVATDDMVLSGIASMLFTGSSILISQPENGALISEYSLTGQEGRSFGRLRATSHEDDRDLHLALNSGIPLSARDGGLYFVFHAGAPVFRKYDRSGALTYERHMQGAETDRLIDRLPASWPRQDGELPVVRPTVRAAGVDSRGNLWVALADPFTYVFDPQGDKIRVVQFRGAGVVTPSALFFAADGRLLVTPGLHEFEPWPPP